MTSHSFTPHICHDCPASTARRGGSPINPARVAVQWASQPIQITNHPYLHLLPNEQLPSTPPRTGVKITCATEKKVAKLPTCRLTMPFGAIELLTSNFIESQTKPTRPNRSRPRRVWRRVAVDPYSAQAGLPMLHDSMWWIKHTQQISKTHARVGVLLRWCIVPLWCSILLQLFLFQLIYSRKSCIERTQTHIISVYISVAVTIWGMIKYYDVRIFESPTIS